MVERFRIPPPPHLPALAAAGVAIGLPLVAFAFQAALRSIFEGIPYILFMLVVALSAWAGGLASAALATLLSAGLGYGFMLGNGPASAEDAPVATAVFAVAAAVIGTIASAARAGFRERERAAETLRLSEARERARAEELQAIMDAVPAAVLIARDPQARSVSASRGALELLRISPGGEVSKTGERPPTHYRVLQDGVELAPDDLPTQAAARRGERLRDLEVEIAFDDGTHRMLLGNAEPLFDERGRTRGAVSAFVDVTKLSDAVRTRDAFLAMASHELKTPLTSLQLQAESLLRAGERVPPPVRKAADAMRRQVVRLTALVNTLLDVSRLNEGRLRLLLEPVELSAVVRDVASRFGADSESNRSRIQVDAPEAVAGRWDRLRVEQVVTNLLSNALKYGEGRAVGVRVDRDGGTARLTVADHGIGIASADQDRIFERFERGHSARGYGGFGLGLWISREIVTALGGRIEVESSAGSGSTFRVSLPVQGPGPTATEEAGATAAAR